MIDISLQKLFLESDLYPKLIKNNITSIKELILKKPKKYENFVLSDCKNISDKKKINLYGEIIEEPIFVNNIFKKKIKMFKIIVDSGFIFKIIIFNNFFFQII
ncbi:DEAD/DEAH box helicase [Candidatus Phytoplasma luffae]|uniref:DEAD/DEAH box helicase n=1 Tax=Loofah witches'-broom phytoplasma TaxID=35773 RepID=A0A975IM77_LOWBP|nr:hypothetical protein [Candidatus Phytoplasma luffae]QTX02824.1 DEAD/DEAH box helicase [Candidatus Phytoplasma luffae]